MPLTEGKPVPTELSYELAALGKEIELEDENTAGNVLGTIYPLLIRCCSIEVVLILIENFNSFIASIRCEDPINN